MILVDTSVWMDHLRRDNRVLAGLLDAGRVWTHEFVLGELACGNLKNRPEILYFLSNLPMVPTAGHDDVLALIEQRRLHGVGLGWIDVHLLASAVIDGLPLWTLDRSLTSVTRRLSVGVRARDLD